MQPLQVIKFGGIALGLGALAAITGRSRDERRAREAWAHLAVQASASSDALTFTPEMVDGLPEPAQRYFHRVIAPGTRLRLASIIDMTGKIGLGTKTRPGYMPMRAREIIAPPHGFVWAPRIGSGLLQISGADAFAQGHGWTSFWLGSLIPVARSRPSADFDRSAAARSILEALWAPASLLPINGVIWEPIDQDRARAVFTVGGERFPLELRVGEDGLPISVAMARWTNANPEGVFRWQPTGGFVEEIGTFGGYTITSNEAPETTSGRTPTSRSSAPPFCKRRSFSALLRAVCHSFTR